MCYLHTTNIFHTTLLVILFIYLILFKKKEEKRVKPGHLQQIKKKIMGLSFQQESSGFYLDSNGKFEFYFLNLK
jgi:hypothetical protein